MNAILVFNTDDFFTKMISLYRNANKAKHIYSIEGHETELNTIITSMAFLLFVLKKYTKNIDNVKPVTSVRIG